MINPFLEINWSPQRNDIRSFGKVFCISALCLSIFMVLFFKEASFGKTVSFYAVVFGVLIFILSFLLPTVVVPFYLLWHFISACIGIVVSNLLLTLFYYCIFSPFAIIGRVFSGRDPLTIRKSDKKSYWVNVVAKDDLRRYFKQY